MPPDERATKAAEWCETHPSRVSVAACERCGRALCLVCAVPVRGSVLGPECLTEALGDDAPAPDQPRIAPDLVRIAAGAAFGVAAAATLLPWTRFGAGSGFLGAWALDLRWSMAGAVASVTGLAVWLFFRGRPAIVALLALAALGVTGSLFAILNPPPFTKPALAPWISLGSAVLAMAVLLVWARRSLTSRV